MTNFVSSRIKLLSICATFLALPLQAEEAPNAPMRVRNSKGTFLQSQGTIQALSPSEAREWHHLSPPVAEGIRSQDVYRDFAVYLKAYQDSGATQTVAVIDSGVDITHPDLQGSLWVNAKEIPNNGIDDDQNGFPDDIFGWSFLGKKTGGSTFNDDDNNWSNGFTYLPGPSNQQVATDLLEFAREYYRLTAKAKTAALTAQENTYFNRVKSKIQLSRWMYRDYNTDIKYDPRTLLVADNQELSLTALRETQYGNNTVVGPDAKHGTHVAGIIAANRNNSIGANGIASRVKIMAVRVVPDGDERDKDVANGIRYAVDNGATIINMSFGKSFSIAPWIVSQALEYAASKGVVVFHAAGNDGQNNDVTENYPSKFPFKFDAKKALDLQFGVLANRSKKAIPQVVEVGASTDALTALAASFSNFGRTTVDLFSPGQSIYSTVLNGGYASFDGTSMASPVAAGALALLQEVATGMYLSCKPAKVNAPTVKNLVAVLLKNVRVPESTVAGKKGQPFVKLSSTGGVVDVYKAAEELKATYCP